MMTVYVAEYSRSQDCFHVTDLEHAIFVNKHIILCGKDCDYIPFAITDGREKAMEACNRMRDQIGVREHSKDKRGKIIDDDSHDREGV